jgi:DNA-binding FadR family transcriptional regulator
VPGSAKPFSQGKLVFVRIDGPDAFLQGDLALHRLVTAAAHDEIIARFMASLNRLGTAGRRRTGALTSVCRQSALDHQALVEAIARRDPDAAAIMRQHLEQIQTGLRERVAQEGAQATPQGASNVADHNVG